MFPGILKITTNTPRHKGPNSSIIRLQTTKNTPSTNGETANTVRSSFGSLTPGGYSYQWPQERGSNARQWVGITVSALNSEVRLRSGE